MPRHRFLASLRALAECYHAFGRFSGRHVRSLGYTPPQFDVIATLGNTDGMTFKDLGNATLITKGTLTGVIDRLETRGIVARAHSRTDGRSTVVKLTVNGVAEFDRVFNEHIQYLRAGFENLEASELDTLDDLLRTLHHDFESATTKHFADGAE
jgi:MarR family 2-MHQ and catechol resistance regulon transcriptional repressor